MRGRVESRSHRREGGRAWRLVDDGHARARRAPDERGRASSLRRRPRMAVRAALAAVRTGVFPERTVERRRDGRAGVVVREVRVDADRAPLADEAAADVWAEIELADEVRARLAPLSITAGEVPEVRAAVVRAGEVCDEEARARLLSSLIPAVPPATAEEARAPLALRAIAPRAIATRARLGVRRNPRTIRWVKVSALLSASVQNR